MMNIPEMILDTIPMFFFLWDRKKKETIYLSDKFYDHRSRTYYAPDTPKEDLRQYIHPDSQEVYDHFFDSLSKENNYHDYVELKAALNLLDIEWLQLSTYPVDNQCSDSRYVAGHINKSSYHKGEYHLLQDQVESLDVVTYLLAHELSAPLTNVMGLSEMLKYKAREVAYPALYLPFFDSIHDASGEVLVLARGLISLIELEANQTLVLQELKLSSFLRTIKEGFFLKSVNEAVELIYSTILDNVVVRVDAEKFRRGLESLIVYLLKYDALNHDIFISADSLGQDKIAIRLLGKGVELPQRDIRYLLEIPQRLRINNVKGKTTKGLLEIMIAKEIVNLHHGELAFWQEEGSQGFVITLSQ